MAEKSLNSDEKIMDVSKPGKGKIETGSRPVISGSDTTVKDNSVTQPEAIKAPSASRKVIQPLSSDIKPEESIATSIQVVSDDTDPSDSDNVVKVSTESTNEQVATDNAVDSDTEPKAEETPAEPDSKEESAKDTEPVDSPANAEPETQPEVTESKSDEKLEKDSGSEPESSEVESSDAAGVDELAKKAEEKKMAAKKAEEEKLRFAEVDDLAASKKYYVKTSHAHHDLDVGGSSKSKFWLIIIGTLLILIAGYLVVDAKVVDNQIELPYEFFKEQAAEDSSTSVTEKTENQTENNQEKPAEDEPAAEQTTASPEDRAADDERKTELKNLQQRLETHFNDYGIYPASLSEIVPAPTEDETTDENGTAYLYIPSGDKTTYELSTKLLNSNDPDADANGNYVLMSVNQ